MMEFKNRDCVNTYQSDKEIRFLKKMLLGSESVQNSLFRRTGFGLRGRLILEE